MTATPTKLTNFEVESVLTQLPGWTIVAGKLHREYRFLDFGKAFGFMKTAAPAIEKMDHHPEWFNAYDCAKGSLNSWCIITASETIRA